MFASEGGSVEEQAPRRAAKGERGLLQVGGLSGIVSGLLVIVFSLLFPPGGGLVTSENLRLVLENSTRFLVGVSIELIGGLLLVPLFLALYRNLREASVGYAMVGGVFGVLGAVLSAIASLSEGSTLFLAQLYDKASATDKPMVLTVAQAVSMIGGGFFVISVVLLALALVAVGGAMLAGSAFRKWHGWLGIISGVGLGIGVILVIGFLSPAGFLLFLLGELVWPVVVGLKVYRLSKIA